MPITKSAQKAMRGSRRKRVVNLVTIGKYKDALRAARKTKTAAALSAAFKQLDKAVKKHVIHANKAARLKSRLSKAIAKKA